MKTAATFSLALSLSFSMGAATAASGSSIDALVDKFGCMSCHGMARKQIGPGFVQIAERYRGDSTAALIISGKLRNGSVGTWGRVIMPRQPNMTDAEADELARWVLLQRPTR